MFTILLVLHVGIAAIALGGGFLALLASKGRPLHRTAGRIFVATMLAMTSVAFVLALMHDDRISIVPSLLSFYLVATGARTVMRKQAAFDSLDFALLLFVFAVACTGYALGYVATFGARGLDAKGFPSTVYFVFASIALLAAALDLRVRFSGPPSGHRRLARHLWRMGLALVIATTSLFQGQEQVFPKAVQGTVWLELPALIVIGVLLYWLARLFLRRTGAIGSRMALPAAGEPSA